MTPLRIFVVDDEPVIRKGLRLLISRQPDLEVCGEAETCSAAMEQILALKPDLVIVDLTLKQGFDGFELIRRLTPRRLRPRILVFSMHQEPPFIRAAFQVGADAFVAKVEGSETLLSSIRKLLGAKAPRSLHAAGRGQCPHPASPPNAVRVPETGGGAPPP